MFSEITVIIKDDEKTLKKKFGIYDPYTVEENNEIIKNCIDETLKNFDGTPDDIKVKISLEIQ